MDLAHPLFRNKYLLRAYAVSWIPIAIMYRVLLQFSARISPIESVALTVPLVLLLSLACTLPWYACRALPIGVVSPWKLIVGHLVMTMWISAVLVIIVHWVAIAWSSIFQGLSARFLAAAPAVTVTVALTYLLATALHYVVQAVDASREAEIQSREAQLKALKAQVNPHFLFNSLNSISALTAVNPARAREMCVKLSDFLRTSLRLGESTSLSFNEELQLTRTYLDVEQVRFGDRLRVRQEIQSECATCELPPMLLQPLVENAVRHGVATLIEGGEITISGERVKDRIKLMVENPYDPDAPAVSKTGFGLSNVRNRMQARWGAAAKMDINAEKNRYCVTLSFPYEKGKRI